MLVSLESKCSFIYKNIVLGSMIALRKIFYEAYCEAFQFSKFYKRLICKFDDCVCSINYAKASIFQLQEKN